MKNPFKKSSIVDTLVNVGIGGAANVAMDYVWDYLPESVKSIIPGDDTKNYVKIAVGALGGSMVKNKYARPAFDGIATVGVSEIISGLIKPAATSGAPFIGRAPRLGQRGFRPARVRGAGNIAGEPFMGK